MRRTALPLYTREGGAATLQCISGKAVGQRHLIALPLLPRAFLSPRLLLSSARLNIESTSFGFALSARSYSPSASVIAAAPPRAIRSTPRLFKESTWSALSSSAFLRGSRCAGG